MRPRVVPRDGLLAWHYVDLGSQFLQHEHLEAGLEGCQMGSLNLSHGPVKTKFTVKDVENHNDQQPLEIICSYQKSAPTLARSEGEVAKQLCVFLPSLLLGLLAMASVWLQVEGKAVVNAVLLAGVALQCSASHQGSQSPTSCGSGFHLGTALFVFMIALLDNLATSAGDLAGSFGQPGSEVIPDSWSAYSIAELICLGVWLASPLLLWSHWMCGSSPRDSAADSTEPPTKEPQSIPEALVEMTGSLLHTQWRWERAKNVDEEMVPRWKEISEDECKRWLSKFDEKQREGFKGILYVEAPIKPEHRKEWLMELQAKTDANRIPAGPRSDRSTSPVRSSTRRFAKKQRQSIEEVTECIGDYLARVPELDLNRDHDRMHVVDINNDYQVPGAPYPDQQGQKSLPF